MVENHHVAKSHLELLAKNSGVGLNGILLSSLDGAKGDFVL